MQNKVEDVLFLDTESRKIVNEVNWRQHLVMLAALMASILAFSIVYAMFDYGVRQLTLLETAEKHGSGIFTATWVFLVSLYAVFRNARVIARAEEDYDTRFRFWKFYKVIEE